MQGALFARILDMSLLGCYSIAVVLLARLLLRKCERKYSYYLWLIVFANLSLPFRPQGIFSLIPGRVAEFSIEEQMSQEDGTTDGIETDRTQMIKSFTESGAFISESPAGASAGKENFEEPAEGPAVTNRRGAYGNAFRQALGMMEGLWLLGILALLIYNLIHTFRLYRRLVRGRKVSDGGKRRIIESEGVDTPFLWGLFRPVIYLPSGMEPDEKGYIIAHESCHRRRGDQLVKLLVFAVTVVHWFNPFVWLAYELCCRDMEISCDESVLACSGRNIRRKYAASLLRFAAKQSGYRLTPLTFGEPSVKSRIKNVLHYKKKGLIFSVLALLCVMVVALGLAFRPIKSEETIRTPKPNKQNENHTEISAGKTPNGGEAHVIRNNGGSIVELDGTLYYMQGLSIYTDGAYLYVTGSSMTDTYRYELDGSGYKKLFEGRILDIRGDGQELYYTTSVLSSMTGVICSFSLQTEESTVLAEDSWYLGRDEEVLYVRRMEKGGSYYLDAISKESHAIERNLLKQSLPEGEIKSFYPAGDTILFAAGSAEGSMGLFNGDFYSYSKTDGTMKRAHLTDSGSFQAEMTQGGIYYQACENAGEGGSVLCRANYHLEKTDELGDDLELLDIDETRGAVLAAKRSELDSRISNLVLLDSKTGEETLLLDMQAEKWEVYDYDKLQFSEWSFLDEVLYVKVAQWGYREGGDWRDNLIREQYYRVNLDGSGAKSWDPNEAAAEIINSGAVVGTPCDPEAEGWDFAKVEDVRENFSRMNPAEEVKEERTLLLGQTDTYTLYGKGDFETMLLEHDGYYAQIPYPYTSNYMIPVELAESDYDRDGGSELAVRIQVKHGTGAFIDTFFMADPKVNGELFVYEFQEKDYLAELQPHISWAEGVSGVQPLIDGKEAGVPLETEEDEPPVKNISVGGQIRFCLYTDDIQISAGLEFWREGFVGIAEYNGSDLTAWVRYSDGGLFTLDGFSSRDVELEDKLSYALYEYYKGSYINEKGQKFLYGDGPVEGFQALDFHYDPTRLHEGLAKVIVGVIPEGSDSYDYANVTVRWAGVGGEYKRWIVEDIYLEK